MQSEMARVANGGVPARVDSSRYEALPPEGALEKDLQVNDFTAPATEQYLMICCFLSLP